MTGIVSFGAYVPLRRLGQGTQGWRSPGEKAAAYYDEDSLTMAVAAAIDCLGSSDRSKVDGLYAASTTLPYKEKLAATTIALAADLRRDIFTADVVDTLRAGTGALRMACDTVKAGTAKQVMVTASDCRLAAPRSADDQSFGDGAAAFIIGNDGVVAELEKTFSFSNELFDNWRSDNGIIQTWEDRWVLEEGYLKVMPMAVKEAMKKAGFEAKDITRAVIYGPNTRRYGQVVKTLGFAPPQLADSLLDKVGNAGVASVPMMLVAALEQANPGDRIMVASYGDGADVMFFKVTDAIKNAPKKRGIAGHLAHKYIIPGYDMYLGFQQRGPAAGRGLPAAPSVLAREKDAIYPLYGTKCTACGTVEYPPQRVCSICKAKDKFEYIRMSDSKAKIFDRVPDFAAPVPPFDSPVLDLLLDFDKGGRANFMLTDKRPNAADKPNDIPKNYPIGMEVEMTFRRLSSGGGMTHYWWKAMPLRETW